MVFEKETEAVGVAFLSPNRSASGSKLVNVSFFLLPANEASRKLLKVKTAKHVLRLNGFISFPEKVSIRIEYIKRMKKNNSLINCRYIVNDFVGALKAVGVVSSFMNLKVLLDSKFTIT